jgi:prepilin-type N-terminal cleavage/methylation domain-containing protein
MPHSARRDTGFTLIELLVVVAIVSILAALGTAGLLRSRNTANEVSAIASLKTTVNAQKAYAASCGAGGYAASFVVLGTPPGGGDAYISSDLGSVLAPVKNGFQYALGAGAGSAAGPNDCLGTATITAYYGSASPLSWSTGSRAFAVNRLALIWQAAGLAAPAEPFGAPATPIQ